LWVPQWLGVNSKILSGGLAVSTANTANSLVQRDGSGNFQATTASALSANPGNCPAGQAAAGVDASGAAEGCFGQSFVNDTNIAVSSVGATHTVQWNGSLAKSRQNAATVYGDTGNIWSAGTQDFAGAGALIVPRGSAAPAAASCDAFAEVGSIYVRSGDPNASPTGTYICAQTGVSSFAWQPISFRSGTTAPAACALGDLFFDTDATAGQNLLGCTAANTWTMLSSVGGSGSQNLWVVSDSGSTDAYAPVCSGFPASYSTGLAVILRVSLSNTGAASLNCGPGVKPILMTDGTADPPTGGIAAGNPVTLIYDAAADGGSGGWILQNPRSPVPANTVSAGPVSGVDAVPDYRSLTDADIPGLDAAKVMTGLFPTSRLISNPSGSKCVQTSADGLTFELHSGNCGTASAASVQVYDNGTLVATRGGVNFVPSGTIMQLITDQSGGDRVAYSPAVNTSVIQSLANDQSGAARYCAAASGSGNAYTCMLTPSLTAYSTGQSFIFHPDVNNSGAGDDRP
jgi:hypothetical protein